MAMEYIRRGASPTSPYVPAVVAEGRFVFVSGQISTRHGTVVAGTIAEQTALLMANISGILAAAGGESQRRHQVLHLPGESADLPDSTSVHSRIRNTGPSQDRRRGRSPGDGVETDCIAAMP